MKANKTIGFLLFVIIHLQVKPQSFGPNNHLNIVGNYSLNSQYEIDNQLGWRFLYGNNISFGNANQNGTYFHTGDFRLECEAAELIHLQPNTIITNLSSEGVFSTSPYPNDLLSIASFHTNGWENIAKNDRFEIGIVLPKEIQNQIDNFFITGQGINPYDPDQIKIQCTYHKVIGPNYDITPSNIEHTYVRYGYHFRDYEIVNNNWQEVPTDHTFRVNFSPPIEGGYACEVRIILNNQLSSYYALFNMHVDPSSNRGKLSINGQYGKLQQESGDMFFAIGRNLQNPFYQLDQNKANNFGNGCGYWPWCIPASIYDEYRSDLVNLAQNGCNFVRIRLDPMDGGFPVEWKGTNPYYSTTNINKPLIEYLNNYDNNQIQMWEFDKVLKTCEANNLYIMLNLLGDADLTTGKRWGIQDRWEKNPYSALCGSGTNGVKMFFTDATAKDIYKKQLFYIMARWGYSSMIGLWELINETDEIDRYTAPHPTDTNADNGGSNIYKNDYNFRVDVANWICEMKNELQSYYPNHPVTNGFAGNNESKEFNTILQSLGCSLDVSSTNSYRDHILENSYNNANWDDRFNYATSINNPHILGEIGPDSPIDNYSDREYHNAIWATSMMGGIGSGLLFSDPGDDNGMDHRKNFRPLRNFVDFLVWNSPLRTNKNQSTVEGNFTNNYTRKDILNFYQMDFNKTYVFGWAMNKSSVWFHDRENFTDPLEFDTIRQKYPNFYAGDPYDINDGLPNIDPDIVIPNLKVSSKYKYQIFDTYSENNSTPLQQGQKNTNLLGSLSFHRKMPFNGSAPFYPDYAYIVHHVSNLPLHSGTNEAEYFNYSIGDTGCINALNYLEVNAQYQVKWQVNGQISTGEVYCYQNISDSLLTIHLNVLNLSSNEIYSKDFIILNDDFNRVNEINNVKSMLIYPNPSNTVINIKGDQVEGSYSIELFNNLGQLVLKSESQNTIDVSELSNGIYTLKFAKGEWSETQKLIIQH